MTETSVSAARTEGGGQSVSVIISDSTAKWVVICLLALGVGYAVVKSQTAVYQAQQAQTGADLAKYYTIDMEVYLYKQGLTPPVDPWRKPKGAKK